MSKTTIFLQTRNFKTVQSKTKKRCGRQKKQAGSGFKGKSGAWSKKWKCFQENLQSG